MTSTDIGSVRLKLIGVPGTEFREAAQMARQSGAIVDVADSCDGALEQLREGIGDLVMIDVTLDVVGFLASLAAERITVPVIACGVEAPADRAVAAIRAGARDYLPLPPNRDLIAAAISSVAYRPAVLIGESVAMKNVAQFAQSMAACNAAMLLRGEPGTGKHIAARVIHDASGRKGHFVTLECAGVEQDILESELFGHEPGAFPGAVARRVGRLEEAAEGTIYIREIGMLPAMVQARLYEAFQSGKFTRLGGKEEVPVRTRLLAGSSVDLSEKVAKNAFRSDLFERLRLAEVTLPPLRKREGDVPLLAQHFIAEIARSQGLPPRHLTPEAIALLERHDWPANVAELEHMLHRAMLMAKGGEIDANDLVLADGTPLEIQPGTDSSDIVTVNGLVGRSMADVERDLILHTLQHCGGNRTSASSILGISVRTMRNKLRGFIEAGIPVEPAH